MKINMYTIETAFELLKSYKITSHKESIRRWLREGKIKGVPPTSRKEGWMIKEEDLFTFIRSKMPEDNVYSLNAWQHIHSKRIRTDMWWELIRKNIFEGFLEIKKSQVKECIEHMGFSKEFEKKAWEIIEQHKRGYATPRIPYLLEAALFEDQRIVLDQDYEIKEEQILYPILEYIRNRC